MDRDREHGRVDVDREPESSRVRALRGSNGLEIVTADSKKFVLVFGFPHLERI